MEHQWNGCKCAICGQIRDAGHDWGDTRCRKCGEPLNDDEIARRWAEELQGARDYPALAAYVCTHRSDDDFGLWSEKRSHAVAVLRTAGAEAFDAILSELERGEAHDIELAKVLVRTGDPRAVPLLKRFDDRNYWGAYGSRSEIKEFVDRYPDLHGEVEMVSCPLCDKVRPVTEMRRYDEMFFCEGYCWSKRGRLVEHGIGYDCPHYDEGVCMFGGRDTGLCSLQAGSYATSCNVYRRTVP